MNGQQAMARDAALLRQMAPHLTDEEMERYAYLAGNEMSTTARAARTTLEDAVEALLADERESAYERGYYAGRQKQRELFAQGLRAHADAIVEITQRATTRDEATS